MHVHTMCTRAVLSVEPLLRVSAEQQLLNNYVRAAAHCTLLFEMLEAPTMTSIKG
jgi:hypothetical protein